MAHGFHQWASIILYCSGAKITIALRFFLWIQLKLFASDSDELHAHSTPARHLLPRMLQREIEEKFQSKSNEKLLLCVHFGSRSVRNRPCHSSFNPTMLTKWNQKAVKSSSPPGEQKLKDPHWNGLSTSKEDGWKCTWEWSKGLRFFCLWVYECMYII